MTVGKCDLRKRKKSTDTYAENVGRRKTALEADRVQPGEYIVVCKNNQVRFN